MQLFSTAYLPPVEYLYLYWHAEKPFIEEHENYIKQTYRNRCLIPTSNGILPLTIPLKKNNLHNCPITQIQIDYSQPWQIKHWRAIESAYNKSPFFMYYKDYFEPFYARQDVATLWQFNRELFNLLLKLFNIPSKHAFTDHYTAQLPHDDIDYRSLIQVKNRLKNDYPFGEILIYNQVFVDKIGFESNMSCIDLLFNEGKFAQNILKK